MQWVHRKHDKCAQDVDALFLSLRTRVVKGIAHKGQQDNACNLGTRTRQTLCGWDESHHTKLRLSWINLSTTDVTDTEFALSTQADLVQAQSLVSSFFFKILAAYLRSEAAFCFSRVSCLPINHESTRSLRSAFSSSTCKSHTLRTFHRFYRDPCVTKAITVHILVERGTVHRVEYAINLWLHTTRDACPVTRSTRVYDGIHHHRHPESSTRTTPTLLR